jgi:hypothetical protein
MAKKITNTLDSKLLKDKRNKITTYFNCIIALAEEFQNIGRMEGKLLVPGKSSKIELFTVLNLLYAKSIRTFRAIYHLCYEGYAPEAMPLLRALFEAEISLQYIRINGTEAGIRYFEYLDYYRYRFYERNPKLDSINQLPRRKREKEAETLKTKAEIFKNKFPDYKNRKDSWSGKSISDMAKIIDQGLNTHYLIQYETAYNYYSSFCHSNIIAGLRYISKNAWHFKSSPDLGDILYTFADASLRILDIIFIWARMFGIDEANLNQREEDALRYHSVVFPRDEVFGL